MRLNDHIRSFYYLEYPLWFKHYVYDLSLDEWRYVENVYLESDHDMELYVLQIYAPEKIAEFKAANPNYVYRGKMTFGDSFINHHWMRYATERELLSLEWYQLKKLEQAIRAQYGYVFMYDDLIFFNQFPWYRKITTGKTTQDNAKINYERWDQKRLKLLKKLYNGKVSRLKSQPMKLEESNSTGS